MKRIDPSTSRLKFFDADCATDGARSLITSQALVITR
jgi:hypothetical protein